jgi:hypothetical protein
MFVPISEEETRGWLELHNEKLRNCILHKMLLGGSNQEM